VVAVRLSVTEIARMDRARGRLSRSRYLRHLLEQDWGV
jgi:hypothetical protein